MTPRELRILQQMRLIRKKCAAPLPNPVILRAVAGSTPEGSASSGVDSATSLRYAQNDAR
jgi:hypothetical protein